MVKQLARHWAVQAWGGPAEGRPETAVPAESRPEAVATAAKLQELSCAVRRLEALVAGLAEGVKAHAEPAGHAGGGEQPEPGTAEKPADHVEPEPAGREQRQTADLSWITAAFARPQSDQTGGGPVQAAAERRDQLRKFKRSVEAENDERYEFTDEEHSGVSDVDESYATDGEQRSGGTDDSDRDDAWIDRSNPSHPNPGGEGRARGVEDGGPTQTPSQWGPRGDGGPKPARGPQGPGGLPAPAPAATAAQQPQQQRLPVLRSDDGSEVSEGDGRTGDNDDDGGTGERYDGFDEGIQGIQQCMRTIQSLKEKELEGAGAGSMTAGLAGVMAKLAEMDEVARIVRDAKEAAAAAKAYSTRPRTETSGE